jgi:hypothetical protein
MSGFRFSRWLAGSGSLLAVILIAAGGASAATITLWDFAALLGNTGPCQNLGVSTSVPQGGGSIVLSSPDATVTVKGGDLPVGDTERGLGLSQPPVPPAPCNGDEVGDPGDPPGTPGTGTLLMNFNNVHPLGSTVTSVDLGSLQTGECYRVSISTDLGVTFGAAIEACDGDINANKTLAINLPTAGLVLKFEKATVGVDDNDYTVKSVTTSGEEGCTFTQGYWKTHGGTQRNIPNAWPVDTLTIGGIAYTKAELIAIMISPTKGNGIMSLVQQLIAAKLNVLSGADDSSIFQAIINADKMIDDAGDKIVPPYTKPTSPFLAPAVTSALNTALTNFNAGVTGPGHCN